ncbi:MAG: ABC transporter ATP-binding protein, partial [Oscillospiraceae bacterium]|nr:ABC transporter ATP-binding protein [Oscillospiraceae bacterium]
MVEIKNLSKYYGTNPAVKGIDFEIRDNEILGFLGPNGAGKSTTMNIIAGYLPSTGGTVTINGFDITEQASEAKKCIGYLPEIPPVYPDMRVEEYLNFVAGLKGVPKAERKQQVESSMERLHITDMRRRLIRNLSKGYKQRVGFAQALLGNPKILILDEPTVGLDPTQVMEVRNLILELKKDHSIIFSSHILAEVSAVCERVVIINKGEIMAIDTIENLERSMTADTVLNLTAEGDKEKITRLLKDIRGVVAISSVQEITENRN